ncbi:MAG: hypothetical protein R2932_15080 [Caldilineaceae bacterium]
MSWELLKGWDKVFADSEKEIAFSLEKANVRASGWAMGRSETDIEKEAARRLKEEQGIDYKLPEKR